MKFSTICLSLVSSLGAVTVAAHGDETLVWSVIDTKLPEPISDMTATLGTGSTNKDLVYIAGGCNDPKGNIFDEETAQFSCLSITDALYSFNPSTNEFVTLPSLPRARYRHGATMDSTNNRLWLMGGRTLMDDVIMEVDVFDFDSNTWLTPGNLTMGISDNAAFSFGGEHVYIAGGWNQDYNALNNAWRINATNIETIDQEAIASLSEARGDVKAAVDANGMAHIAGGFTDANGYCPALSTSERFDGTVWTSGSDLQFARGDKALVLLDGHLVALGGEKAIDATCANTNPDHGGRTVTIDEVEVLSAEGVWEEVASIPQARFRFDAVVVNDKLYAFGGQNSYDDVCKCFSSSNEIIVFTEEEEKTPLSGATVSSAAVSMVLMAAAATILM